MNVYATSQNLATWTGTSAPANADSLLRSATVVVAVAAGRNPYDPVPTDPVIADPLRDATTAQATAWIALGVTPDTLGLDAAPVKRSKVGTADVERDTTGQLDARKAAAGQLAPEAEKILQAAGLLLFELPYFTADTDQLLDYGLPRTWPQVVPSPWWS